MKEGCDMPSGENTCVRTASFRHEVVVLLAMSSMLVNHKKTPQTSFIYFLIYRWMWPEAHGTRAWGNIC